MNLQEEIQTVNEETVAIDGRPWRVERDPRGQPLRLLGKRAIYTLELLPTPSSVSDRIYRVIQSNGRIKLQHIKDKQFNELWLYEVDGRLLGPDDVKENPDEPVT